MEAVLAIEIMQVPQSNLEEKVTPSILKDDFSSKTDPSIFTSIAKINKALSVCFNLFVLLFLVIPCFVVAV